MATLAELGTQIAKDIKKRGRATVLDVRDYGAKGDNATDDTAALQAAFDAADAAQARGQNVKVFMPFATFKTTGDLKIKSSLDGSQATINYFGAGTALTIGERTTVLLQRTYEVPRLLCRANINRVGYAPDNAPITGLRAINLNDCILTAQLSDKFDEGIVIEGNNQGFAYTNVWPGTISSCRRGIILRTTDVGWVNQNQFFGGRVHSPGAWGTPIVGDPLGAQLIMEQGTGTWSDGQPSTAAPNNNTFIGLSLEGVDVAQYRVHFNGMNNIFLNCRWERTNTSQPYNVIWKSRAKDNVIFGGYEQYVMKETWETGARNNKWVGTEVYARAVSHPETIPTTTLTPLAGWAGRTQVACTYDAATGEWSLRPGQWRLRSRVNFEGATAAGRVETQLQVNGAPVDVAISDYAAGHMPNTSVDWTGEILPGDKVRVVTKVSAAGTGLVTSKWTRQCQVQFQSL